MLRRHNSQSRAELRRRKSTSSTRSVQLEHINPVAARRDAHLAATQAFARGRDRSSTEMPLFPPPAAPPRGGADSPSRSIPDSTMGGNGGNHGPGVRRRQSVRFVESRSGQQQRSSGATAATSSADEESRPQGPAYSFDSTSNAQHADQRRPGEARITQPLTRSFSLGRSQTARKHAPSSVNRVDSLLAEEDQYTLEEGLASMPSSYRRLRRSRSLFTTANSTCTTTVLSTTEKEESVVPDTSVLSDTPANGVAHTSNRLSTSRYAVLNEEKEDEVQPVSPILRAPKSMSFLRNRRTIAASVASREETDPVFEASRHSTLTSPRPSSLRSRSSLFFLSRNRRSDVPMRKTLRSVPSGSALPRVASSASISLAKNVGFKSRARKVSSTLKTKLKSLFGRAKNDDDDGPKIPEQQIQAQKTHVSRFFGSQYQGGDPGDESISRVSMKVPSLHAVPSSMQLHSREGSVESLSGDPRKASDERSRVTSWASSDVHTIVAQAPQETADWEKQRLSVIKENGAHAPSPSITRQGLAASTVQGQDRLAQPILPGPTVNSQRVYSALMKRMSETRQLADIVEQQRRSSSEAIDPFQGASPRSSHGDTDHGRQSPPVTIRCIEPEGQVVPVGSPETTKCRMTDPADVPEGNHHDDSPRDTPVAAATYKTYSDPCRNDRGLTPPLTVLPRIDCRAASPKSVRTRSSAFFGSPECHTFRTTSPYRRALRDAMRASENEAQPQLSGQGEATAVRPDSQRTDTTTSDSKIAYSESVYSQVTADERAAAPESVSGTDEFPETSALENASLFIDVPTYRPTGKRLGSTASSVEWKTWLSADVSKVESSSHGLPSLSPRFLSSARAPETKHTSPNTPNIFGHGYGHVREAAQIGSQDEPSLPTTPLGIIEPNVMKTSNQPRPTSKTTPPSAPARQENEAPASLGRRASISASPPPPIPPRSALRSLASPSLKSIKSARELKSSSDQFPSPGSSGARAARRAQSLARLRSLHGRRTTDSGSPSPSNWSPARLLRDEGGSRDTAAESTRDSAATSPALIAAVQRRFSIVSQREASSGDSQKPQRQDSSEVQRVQDRSFASSDVSPRAGGSKKMVDLFLSSRRRRIASSSGDSAAFL